MIMAVVAEEKRLECLGFENWVNSFQEKLDWDIGEGIIIKQGFL